MEREDEVFVDAEEEITPRRSGRKRRSTAGSVPAASKKSRSAPIRTMPTERSPGGSATGQSQRKAQPDTRHRPPPEADTDPDAFWNRMSGLLGGLESRMKHETDQLRSSLEQQWEILARELIRQRGGWMAWQMRLH